MALGALLLTGAWGGAGSPVLAQGPGPEPSPTATQTPDEPAEVRLAFPTPAPDDPGNPCQYAVAFKRSNAGDHHDLAVCTFDSSGAPAPTDPGPTYLEWSIVEDGGGQADAARFNPAPPEETGVTTAARGVASAGVDAVLAGTSFVTVFLVDGGGATIDRFSIEFEVHRPCVCAAFGTRLTAHKRWKLIRGFVKSSWQMCLPNRFVTLYRVRKGPDEIVGTDATSTSGGWRVETGPRPGLYYASVGAMSVYDAQTNDTSTCLEDQSSSVRRRKPEARAA